MDEEHENSHHDDNDNNDSDHNNGSNHEIDTFQSFLPLIRADSNSSLLASTDSPLISIADSIRIIVKRDSERALFLQNQHNAQSPWTMSQTPMVTSPYLMMFPDLEQRRKKQMKQHAKMKKRQERERRLRNQGRARERAISFDEDVILFDTSAVEEKKTKDGVSGVGGVGANGKAGYISIVHDEEEQWERKRINKLRKVIEKSTSESSMAYSATSKDTNYTSTSASAFTEYSPTNDMLEELRKEFANDSNSIGVNIAYGIVNAFIVLPVIMSFGNIIYQDAFFKPYLPVLVKLTVVSGVVHQLCFSSFSTLPFAVGSVQDAGLIFLSAIASGIVEYCKERNCTDEEILATALVGLSLFTAMLGMGLVVIGQLKLAGYVQMLPTPVVGGYLAFIGYFCGQSALSMLSGITVKGILEWYKFGHWRALFLMLPGVMGGLGIYIAVRKIKHMAVLPGSILMLVSAFYFLLKFTGVSLEDAKSLGLMSRADAPPIWYHSWDYIQFDKVVWAALPGQLITVCSMIVVVALSSSLDIAAIDLEVPKPLAYNYELKMIGLSNLVSGLTGGYTGSYIFSQSIFSLRAGVRSRSAGYVTALVQAVTVVMPISILAFIPNFIFASLLIMIAVDLMIEWLWEVRTKLSKSEYSVALMTFALIQVFGVEYGIVGGICYNLVLSKLGILKRTGEASASSEVEGHLEEKIPIQQQSTTYDSTIVSDDDVGLSI